MNRKNLKNFGQFILDNHLPEFTRENIEILRGYKTPLLQLFSHLSEEELFTISLEGQKEFFVDLISEKALEKALLSLQLWKDDKLPGISRDKVEARDLVLVYSARKKAMRKFLPFFTNEIDVSLDIIDGMEELHTQMEAGAFEVYTEIQREISERKNNLIAKSEQQLKEAQEIASMGSWEFDLYTNQVIWSDQMYRIFGYEPGEIHMDLDTYIRHLHPDDVGSVQQNIADTLQTKAPYFIEHKIIRKDGGVRWIQGRGTVVLTEGEQVLKLAGTGLDITEEKKIRENLEIRTVALEAVNKELEAFCYTVSHDLRSPLRAIDGFGRMFEEDYAPKLDDEGKRLLSIIRNNAKLMGNLIDDLLEFSRLNRKEMHKCLFKMEDLVNQVIQEQKMSAPEIKTSFKIDKLLECYADRAMLHQVWQNLISNAIKFTSKKDNANVEIGSYKKDMKIIYFIKDNGAGFDMKYKDKLFGVFQRLHGNQEFSGTGVGLATVQRIILRNGGSVWAEGKLNEGATFYFSLPEKS